MIVLRWLSIYYIYKIYIFYGLFTCKNWIRYWDWDLRVGVKEREMALYFLVCFILLCHYSKAQVFITKRYSFDSFVEIKNKKIYSYWTNKLDIETFMSIDQYIDERAVEFYIIYAQNVTK